MTLALCILAAAATSVAYIPAGPNLLANAGFEQPAQSGIPGWKAPAAWSVVEGVAHSGRRCARYHNDDPKAYPVLTQDVKVKPGLRYLFEAWVKANLRGTASIGFEWWARDGSYLGGVYEHLRSSRTDWTLLKTVSPPVPSATARANIALYVRRGGTGTAWFDDVKLVPAAEASPVLTVPNYRGILPLAGQPATVSIDLYHSLSAPLRAEARLYAPSGQLIAQTKAEVRRSRRIDLPLPPSAPPGNYSLTLQFFPLAGGEPLAQFNYDLFRPSSPRRPTVYIDRHNRLIVDGKPFFPLGVYTSCALMTDEHLNRIAKAQFNCIMPYGLADEARLDLAHKHGLRVIYSVKDLYAGLSHWCPKEIKTPADERPFIERIVSRFRSHPALLAWYVNDEISPRHHDRLASHQRWMKELDPNHPTWAVVYQVHDIRAYTDTCDAIGTDPYPIPDHPSRAAKWTRMTVQGVCGARPVWMVPQIFNKGAARNNYTRFRPPTFDEMRSMAWQCICEGANGVVFYSYFDLLRDRMYPIDQRWPEIARMVAEIKRWIPVLLYINDVPDAAARGPHIHTLFKHASGRNYLFAVNDDYDPHTLTVASSRFSALLRLSDGRRIPFRRGRAQDTLRPLDMQAYQLLPRP